MNQAMFEEEEQLAEEFGHRGELVDVLTQTREK